MDNINLISIVVPIYKVEKYINKCIESILNQTYKNLEIILVDDGSPDNCGKIADEYAKKDNRIKVIHKQNGGLSDARNAGIDIAKGKYIGFVDSDDYIEKDMYEYLINLINENNTDISICDFKYIYEDETVKRNKEQKVQNITLNKKEALIELLGNKIGNYAWNKLYKAELFKEVRYPVGRKMEDYGTTYKLFDLSNRISLGSENKYNYLQRNDSILHDKESSFYIDFYEMTYERYKFIKNKYSDIIENDIDMVNKILTLFIKKDEKIEAFINQNKSEIKSIFKSITKDKEFKKFIDKKMKIKLMIFKLNKKLFKLLSTKI